MRKDHEDEIWEAEATVAYSQAAENEFTRLKHSLKVKAGLIKEPLIKRIKCHLTACLQALHLHLVRLLRPRQ